MSDHNDQPDRDSSPDARVLRRLVQELSAEGAPELDWDRTESKLFAMLDTKPSALPLTADSNPRASSPQEEAVVASEGARLSVTPALGSLHPRSTRVHPMRGAGMVLVAVAAIAAAFAFYASRSDAPATGPVVATKDVVVDPTQLPEAPGMSGYRQLSALKSGDIVEAEVGPIAFAEQNGVEWTLSAGSRLVVKTAFAAGGEEHVVELDSGSVRGRVHARSDVRFVVTAGETQVVSFSEGAIFTVTRSSKRIVVHMEHGIATVGQKGAQGQRIEAPVFAALGLDGVTGFELLPSETVALSTTPSPAPDHVEAQSEAPRTEPRVVTEKSAEPARSSTAPTATPSASQPAAPSRVLLSSVTPTLFACMNGVRAKQRTEASTDPGLLVTVTSTLKVNIDAEGKVKGVAFSPPLAPSLQNCAVSLFGLTFDAGERTEMIPIQLK